MDGWTDGWMDSVYNRIRMLRMMEGTRDRWSDDEGRFVCELTVFETLLNQRGRNYI